MSKKTRMLKVACWITVAVSCIEAGAQDTSRVPDTNPQDSSAVDASVHADIEDGARQQPARQFKRPTSGYTKWGLQSVNQNSATQFGPGQSTTSSLAPSFNSVKNPSAIGSPSVQFGTPDRVTDSATRPATDGHLGKRDQRSNLFGDPSADRLHDRSTAPSLFGTPVQSFSPQPESSEFSTPSRGKQFVGLGGGLNTFAFPSPFSKPAYSFTQEPAKVNNHKLAPLKPGGDKHSGGVTGSSTDQGKTNSRPVVKPE
jgi:hypothetical protein